MLFCPFGGHNALRACYTLLHLVANIGKEKNVKQ
jgi:hypothetical protein